MADISEALAAGFAELVAVYDTDDAEQRARELARDATRDELVELLEQRLVKMNFRSGVLPYIAWPFLERFQGLAQNILETFRIFAGKNGRQLFGYPKIDSPFFHFEESFIRRGFQGASLSEQFAAMQYAFDSTNEPEPSITADDMLSIVQYMFQGLHLEPRSPADRLRTVTLVALRNDIDDIELNDVRVCFEMLRTMLIP